MKKYQIQTWHMGVTKHDTCDYQMSIAIVGH
jgi:hypothetical protein